MNAKHLMDGLKANYAVSLHPTELHEKDFLRTLRNLGYDGEQLDVLYNELISTCEFFPKVYDLHRCASKLGLQRKGSDAVTQTRRMLDDHFTPPPDAITFDEWLHTGGMETIREDCNYDETKIHRVLNMMGVVAAARPEEKKTDEHHEFEFISDNLPVYDFPEEISLDDL